MNALLGDAVTDGLSNTTAYPLARLRTYRVSICLRASGKAVADARLGYRA
jgi:hypothetical protein